MTDLNKKLSELEQAASKSEPRLFVFPFGEFNSMEEALSHPDCGAYTEQRRRALCPEYAELADKLLAIHEAKLKKENEDE